MAEVGIRELRADLSRIVKRAHGGEEIVVTDRGHAVARLVPMEESRFDRLIREGKIIPATRRASRELLLEIPKELEGAGPLSDLVLGDRR